MNEFLFCCLGRKFEIEASAYTSIHIKSTSNNPNAHIARLILDIVNSRKLELDAKNSFLFPHETRNILNLRFANKTTPPDKEMCSILECICTNETETTFFKLKQFQIKLFPMDGTQ